jgi:hypothetical protein
VGSLFCHFLLGFVVFLQIWLLLEEVFIVGGGGVEFVAFGEYLVVATSVLFVVRVLLFLVELGAVGGGALEGLAVGVELVVFYEYSCFWYAFGRVSDGVL